MLLVDTMIITATGEIEAINRMKNTNIVGFYNFTVYQILKLLNFNTVSMKNIKYPPTFMQG